MSSVALCITFAFFMDMPHCVVSMPRSDGVDATTHVMSKGVENVELSRYVPV